MQDFYGIAGVIAAIAAVLSLIYSLYIERKNQPSVRFFISESHGALLYCRLQIFPGNRYLQTSSVQVIGYPIAPLYNCPEDGFEGAMPGPLFSSSLSCCVEISPLCLPEDICFCIPSPRTRDLKIIIRMSSNSRAIRYTVKEINIRAIE